MMDKNLTKCFYNVRDSLNSAMAHYQIWFTLRGGGKAIEHYLDDMNDYRYVDFFLAANNGHYKLMFIETACLFDSDDRAHSIRSLKILLIDNGFDDVSKKFESKLSPFSDLVTNIKTIRSKVIAHKEVGVSPDELYDKHRIKPDDIKNLLRITAELISELEAKLTEKSISNVASMDRWERATFNLLEALKVERHTN